MNILILLGILVIFVVLFNFASKYTFVTGKRMYWILGTYIIILLISTVFFYTVLDKKASGVKHDDIDQIPNFENVVYGDESLETITPYIVDQQSYFYDHDELFIQVNDMDLNVPILISRESEMTNEIEATVYQAPTIMEGSDITESMPLVKLSLPSEVVLMVDLPWSRDLDLDVYKGSFPFRQFTGERLFADDSNRPHFQVSQLLHLAIPQDIDINIDDDVWYQYLTTD